MEALTAMGFPEHMCAKAMQMTGGDVEAAANYIMGNLDQPEQWWFGPPPAGPDAMAQQLIAESSMVEGSDADDGFVDTMETLLDGLEPQRREAFAEAAVAALDALKATSTEQAAALGIDEAHARLLRELRPQPATPPPPADAGEEAPGAVAASPLRDSPDLAATISASASSALEQVHRLEEALGHAREPRLASPRVVAARAPAPSAATAPNAVLQELEAETSEPPVFLLCGQGLEILDDGLQVRRASAASSQNCWAATTSGRKYVEVVVESISSSLPSGSDGDADRRDPFGGGPADIMLSMLRGEGDGDSPFGSPFGGPFGFGERPLRTQGLTRFGVRTDLEDLDVDGQLHEREGSKPGRATWMLHQKKIVKNGRGVANYSAILDTLRVGDRIGALVHNKSLTFYLNGKSQGVATSGLPSDTRTLHFVVDMQGAVDSFRLLPEHTSPKTQEELEMGTIAGLIKSDSLTRDLLAEKIKDDADGSQARAVDQDGRTALHYLCRDHPGTSAEMLSMLAQAYPEATSMLDRSGKTPLLYLLAADDIDGPPKTVLDFKTEAEYAQYLVPLCRAGAKLQAAKDLNSRVRLGAVGEYVDSHEKKGVQVDWSISASDRGGRGWGGGRPQESVFSFGRADDGDQKEKRWQSWSSVVLAHDDHKQQQAAAAKERPDISVEMIDAFVDANDKCVAVPNIEGLLPVQLAERAAVTGPVLDRLVQLSLAAGLVWCGGRTSATIDADADAAAQYGIHVLLSTAAGAAIDVSSSTLTKIADNAAHRSATRLHGLPFGVDDVKMSVCGPTHLVFLLKRGSVWRLPFTPLAGVAGQDSSGHNSQVKAAEQRLESLRSQVSSRHMRVKQIEAQITAAQNKVFPVPASELQSLCDITRKPRAECETVLRRLRPRASRLELAMHMLMGGQPENNGRPAEFWEGDEVGRLQHELRKETKSIAKDNKQISEIEDSIESASASAATATQAIVKPPVCVGTLEEWQLQVAFTQLAVSQSALLLLAENGVLYRWDWSWVAEAKEEANGSAAPYRGEDPRAREMLQPLSSPIEVPEVGKIVPSKPERDPDSSAEHEPEPEPEPAADPIIQVSSSHWRTSVLTSSGRVASWMDTMCHDAAKRKPPEAPAAVHHGVTCDKSGMNPIKGIRYKLKGKNYDVCAAEFAKLEDEKKLLYVRIAHPHGPEEDITPEEIEADSMARASASGSGSAGAEWAAGANSTESIVKCLEHRLRFPGFPDLSSATATTAAMTEVDDAGGTAGHTEDNDSAEHQDLAKEPEKVVDIAVSNWGTVARTSRDHVYWWGRRPYNPSLGPSSSATAAQHDRTQGLPNIAKEFKNVLSKYASLTPAENDSASGSGRDSSSSPSSLKNIKSEIVRLAGDSDAYAARLTKIGVGTPGADALRTAVEMYQSAVSALNVGDEVVLCSSLDRPLYDINTPVLLQNDDSTTAADAAQTYFLQNPISRLQRERRIKVVNSSGSTTKTVSISDIFFLAAEYQPIAATVLKIDMRRGVVVLLPSPPDNEEQQPQTLPIICDITDVTPIVADSAGVVEKKLRSVVAVSEPCAIFKKQLLGSDVDGRLGSALAAMSADDPTSCSAGLLLSKFAVDSVVVSGWRVTVMLSKDSHELWKFMADVSRACWTCAPMRLKLTSASGESVSQAQASIAGMETPAVHLAGLKEEAIGLGSTPPIWVDDAGYVHTISTASSRQTKLDAMNATSKLPRVHFMSAGVASGQASIETGDGSSSNPGRWEFEDAPGSWRPYSTSDSQRLDDAERKSQSSCALNFPYVVELRSKRQVNRTTGRERRVRRRSSGGVSGVAPGSGDPVAMVLGFAKATSDDCVGGGVHLKFAGRNDLHDAVLGGLEGLQKLLDSSGSDEAGSDGSAVIRKLLLQRDVMGANAFHLAMQHGRVAEASAICAAAAASGDAIGEGKNKVRLLDEMIGQPNLFGTPPMHALLGLEQDQMLLRPQPLRFVEPGQSDSAVASSAQMVQQLKALLLGPAGETLMTATNAAGHTPLQAYICQPPHGSYQADVNKAGKASLVEALVKLLSTSPVAVKSCLLPLLPVGADGDKLDLFVFQLVNRGGGSGDAAGVDTDAELPANFARAVAASELRRIGQIFMQSCVRVYSALYAGKAQAVTPAPSSASTGVGPRQPRQQHSTARGYVPPSRRGGPSPSTGPSGSGPGASSVSSSRLERERDAQHSKQNILSKRREQAFWSVFKAAPALAIEALAFTADKATYMLRLGLPVAVVQEIVAAGQGQILIRASMNDSGVISAVFGGEPAQPLESSLTAAQARSRRPTPGRSAVAELEFACGEIVKLKSSTPPARKQGVPTEARGVIQTRHPNGEVTVHFSMQPVVDGSDGASSGAFGSSGSSSNRRMGRGRTRGTQRERRQEPDSADLPPPGMDSSPWARRLAPRGPGASAMAQEQEQELVLDADPLFVVDRPRDDDDTDARRGPGLWAARPASSIGDAGDAGGGLFRMPGRVSSYARSSPALSASAGRPSRLVAAPGGFGERDRDQSGPGGFGATLRSLRGSTPSASGPGGGASPFGAPIAVTDIPSGVFGGGFGGLMRDSDESEEHERDAPGLTQLLRGSGSDDWGFAAPAMMYDSNSGRPSSRDGSQQAAQGGRFGLSTPQNQTMTSSSSARLHDDGDGQHQIYSWRGPVEYLDKVTTNGIHSTADTESSGTSGGICPKVQRARIFHLCVNAIAELAELRLSSHYQQQHHHHQVGGSGTTPSTSNDDLLSPRTDDVALRGVAKLALADAAQTLQPAWEHVFDCCEIAEEGLTRENNAGHDAGSKQQNISGLAQGQRLPFTAFMQSACGTGSESSVPDPLQYRYIAYMLDALVRFKQSLPAPWESETDDELAVAAAAAAAGWTGPAEAVALGAVANGVAPLVRSVSMIQPLNEGQCDAISASTRRKILRSTFNIDPDPRPQSNGTGEMAIGAAGATSGRFGFDDDDDVPARASYAIGRESGPSGSGSRELLEKTPLVATLLSWPRTLAMLSENYLYSCSDESGNLSERLTGGAGGHSSGFRAVPGSFFQLLEPFHAKESKFRRCMHELLPLNSRSTSSTGVSSSPSRSSARGSSLSERSRTGGGLGLGFGDRSTAAGTSRSGETQDEKLLLKVRRGHDALRTDVCAQLADLRSKCPDGEPDNGSTASELSGRGRPWLCRQLEDTKPWFVDGMGEGKGVVRALVAEFVAAVTPMAPTSTTQAAGTKAENAEASDSDHHAAASPLLVPCPADLGADTASTWCRMVPAAAGAAAATSAAAQQAATETAEPDAEEEGTAEAPAPSVSEATEEGEPGSGIIATATKAADRDEMQAAAVARKLRLEEYRSLGNIAGLCLLHGGEEFGLRLPCYMSRHVYKYLLGREISFVDYAYYDPTEYEALTNLLAQSNSVLSAADFHGEPHSLGVPHSQAVPAPADRVDPDEPIGDGLLEWDESVGVFEGHGTKRRPRPVTARNATAWCFAKARWEMVGKVEDELRAMRLGLHDVIPSSVLAGLALTADDLQMLLTGTGSAFSMDDWRSVVRFEDLRSAGARAADSMGSDARLAAFSKIFWQALDGMTDRQRIDLAFFSTASMTVLDSLTVNLRDLETTALGGELETISARTCTAELNIPDYRDIGYQAVADAEAGVGENAADQGQADGNGDGGPELLRERLLRAAEMAEVLGFTSV